MSIPEVVTGDAISIGADIQVNDRNIVIDLTTQIKAALVSYEHDAIYVPAIEQSPYSEFADWSKGFVVIEFPPSATASLEYQGPAVIEVQLNYLNKPRTWFIPVKVIKGHIV